MTIWSVSMGNAGMYPPVDEPVVTEGCAASRQRRAHAPRLVPAGETDDGPRQVPDFAAFRPSQLRAQRRISAGFPLNRPRRAKLRGRHPDRPLARRGARAVKLRQPVMKRAMTDDHCPPARAVFRDPRRRRAAPGAASAQLHAHRRDGAVQRRLSRPAGDCLRRAARRVAAQRPRARLLSRHVTSFISASRCRAHRLGRFEGRSLLRVGGAAVASSVLFFFITNFGMWLFSGFYPPTSAALPLATSPRFPSSRTRWPATYSSALCCSAALHF